MSESCCSRRRSGSPPAIVVEIQNVAMPSESSSSRCRRMPQSYNAVKLLLRQ
ncbi:hypothetical protein IC582_028762 [Cucumis melo]